MTEPSASYFRCRLCRRVVTIPTGRASDLDIEITPEKDGPEHVHFCFTCKREHRRYLDRRSRGLNGVQQELRELCALRDQLMLDGATLLDACRQAAEKQILYEDVEPGFLRYLASHVDDSKAI